MAKAKKVKDDLDYENMVDDKKFVRLKSEPVEKFYRIKFSKKYDSFSDKAKIEWLEQVASSMNQWAGKLQKLNDEKQVLLNVKESQIESMAQDQSRDREMIQTQLGIENNAKQAQASRIKHLMAEVKELVSEHKKFMAEVMKLKTENSKLIDENLSLQEDIKRLKYGDKH